jgi:hypothetical protein
VVTGHAVTRSPVRVTRSAWRLGWMDGYPRCARADAVTARVRAPSIGDSDDWRSRLGWLPPSHRSESFKMPAVTEAVTAADVDPGHGPTDSPDLLSDSDDLQHHSVMTRTVNASSISDDSDGDESSCGAFLRAGQTVFKLDGPARPLSGSGSQSPTRKQRVVTGATRPSHRRRPDSPGRKPASPTLIFKPKRLEVRVAARAETHWRPGPLGPQVASDS